VFEKIAIACIGFVEPLPAANTWPMPPLVGHAGSGPGVQRMSLCIVPVDESAKGFFAASVLSAAATRIAANSS
jgi:hypothetical protein